MWNGQDPVPIGGVCRVSAESSADSLSLELENIIEHRK